MKKDGLYAKRIHPIVSMAVITIVCILITASLHLATQEQVQANEHYFLQKSVLDAAKLDNDGSVAQVASIYKSSITDKGGYYLAKSSADEERYVIQQSGPGLWGPIVVMIGFNEDLQSLAGVSIVSQTETPGLGARIEESWFTGQFPGKKGPFSLVAEGTASASNQIDAITGATRTSEGFRDIMNNAFKNVHSIVGRQ